MAKQKTATPNVPTLNRKRLVGLQREQFINRILLFSTLAIVFVVIGLVGWATLNQFVIGPNGPVAMVEGKEILGRDFQAKVKINRNQLVNNYMQYVQTMQLFGDDPNFQQQVLAQLQQIEFGLIPEVMGEQTINQMVDEELLKLEAAELGILVSQDRVDQEIQNFLGYFPNGTPTSDVVDTPFPTSTLSPAQLELVTITPTLPPATAAPTLPSTATSTAAPTNETINTPTTESTATQEPSATPYTAEGYATAEADYFGLQESELGLSRQAIYDLVYNNLLRSAISDYLSESVSHTEEQVWARHILVETEAEAQAVLARLNAGGDFGRLAGQRSLDDGSVATGGDLGWFNFQTMVEPFAQAAFDLEIGEISEPVQSDFGFHIIQVLGHEERPLNTQQYEDAVQQALTDFIATLREKYDWEIFETWRTIIPTVPRIPPEYTLQ
jgi:peptidyl-prolyl cis-trans isomerase D